MLGRDYKKNSKDDFFYLLMINYVISKYIHIKATHKIG